MGNGDSTDQDAPDEGSPAAPETQAESLPIPQPPSSQLATDESEQVSAYTPTVASLRPGVSPDGSPATVDQTEGAPVGFAAVPPRQYESVDAVSAAGNWSPVVTGMPTMASTEADAADSSGDGDAQVQPGDVIAEKYRVGRQLGRGGMGVVLQAEQIVLGTPVAVKLMHPGVAADTQQVRRFRREARAASLLNHPNVVNILDFGQHNGQFYIVMEFIEGTSLEDWLDSLDAPPPLSDVEMIMHQLVDAFEAAHDHGIVHRDLKPDNVLLTEIGGGKRLAKVVDFGLAHVEDKQDQGPTLTNKDAVAGTPAYMSPEQCRSLAVGASTDLYAMGCLLTTLLQLRPPFEGETAMDVISQQLFMPPGELNRPADAEPVPPLLERLRLDLLAKRPHQRPQSAAEIRERLTEAMSAELTAQRLPKRKGNEPLGDREGRALFRNSTAPAATSTSTDRASAALVRFDHSDSGVTQLVITGLAAQAITVTTCADVAEAIARSDDAVVVDAGTDIDVARQTVRDLGGVDAAAAIIVCLGDMSTADMNVLIEAGAADVVRYPVTAATLTKRIRRATRKRRKA